MNDTLNKAVKAHYIVGGLLLATFLAFMFIVPMSMAQGHQAEAVSVSESQVAAPQSSGLAMGMAFLGAALATGLGSIGAGVALSGVGAAAMGAITERPELIGKTLIFAGLAEGIAIYGLLISIIILARM